MFGGHLINPNPVVYEPLPTPSAPLPDTGAIVTAAEVFDYIRDIKDPEHPYTLEQLKVVSADQVDVYDDGDDCRIRVEFTPTVPHCSLATLIGLCLREKLTRVLERPFKLDIIVTPGKHSTEAEINKQVNDKERVAAALENPSLMPIVQECIREADY